MPGCATHLCPTTNTPLATASHMAEPQVHTEGRTEGTDTRRSEDSGPRLQPPHRALRGAGALRRGPAADERGHCGRLGRLPRREVGRRQDLVLSTRKDTGPDQGCWGRG